jgi:hypothetical protein
MKKTYIIILYTILTIFALVSWYYGRKINYSFMYKVMVQETIREMVKSEALK